MLLDKDIREALFDYLELEYKKARFYEEKMIGKSRADVFMVIDGALVGIEIKSDADTYARLEGQIKDYDRFFDYNMVVVGSTHALHVEEHVPDHWGIVTVDEVDGKPDFYFLRRPEPNKKVKVNKQLELLWRPELTMILEHFNMPTYKGQSKPFVRKKIIEWTKLPLTKVEIGRIKKAAKLEGIEPVIPETRITLSELSSVISDILFERDYEKMLAEIEDYRKVNNPRRRGTKKSTRVRRFRRLAKQ
ncbi:sce7726 family protein [Pseudobutyrivibrio xylanivorans]|uniref:Sce7726 family protein n=1 Tax=Pseudobutyrivibrio xylanivorans TaxID=185007 RepID=A0A5P6VVS5_PSEXY|nr:sce7726 family protein [Pseudobutyrivibrio xylanivorans]QFJ55401.1 sce7726 family protein [Pseudobutyrivibrio xylanivorans]